MSDNDNRNITGDDLCPDCGVIPGAPHTAMCGARDSGQEIWPGFHGVPVLAAQVSVLQDFTDSLQRQIHELTERLLSLEHQTPEARQAEYEADLAAADLAASGIDERGGPIGTDRHGAGCQCPWCYDETDDYGMPEYHIVIADGKSS